MNILIFLYGILIGSFLNVCIYRIPRGESIIFPSSHCPNCKTNLKWYDLVPVISFIIYRGKCRYCKGEISLQYLFVELFNPIIYLVLFYKFNFSIDFIFYTFIFSILIIIMMIDLKEMIIQDNLVIRIFILSIIYKLSNYILYKVPINLIDSIGGLMLSGGIFILIILISQGGMGGGDVTLIGALGFILGVKYIILTIFLSFILGAIISIFLLITKIKGRKDPIPFGPFIILGFIITLFWGEVLINWYVNMFFI